MTQSGLIRYRARFQQSSIVVFHRVSSPPHFLSAATEYRRWSEKESEKEEESCLFGRDSGQRARSSKVGLALNFVDSVWPRSVILILEAWSKIGRKMLMPAFWPCDFFFFSFSSLRIFQVGE